MGDDDSDGEFQSMINKVKNIGTDKKPASRSTVEDIRESEKNGKAIDKDKNSKEEENENDINMTISSDEEVSEVDEPEPMDVFGETGRTDSTEKEQDVENSVLKSVDDILSNNNPSFSHDDDFEKEKNKIKKDKTKTKESKPVYKTPAEDTNENTTDSKASTSSCGIDADVKQLLNVDLEKDDERTEGKIEDN